MFLAKIKIVGQSMEPTLKNKDLVLVSSVPYFFKNPQKGDLIIFKNDKLFIKRITGIKNEKIFVTGDNKNSSTDSRDFGWIDRGDIIGKVIYRF